MEENKTVELYEETNTEEPNVMEVETTEIDNTTEEENEQMEQEEKNFFERNQTLLGALGIAGAAFGGGYAAGYTMGRRERKKLIETLRHQVQLANLVARGEQTDETQEITYVLNNSEDLKAFIMKEMVIDKKARTTEKEKEEIRKMLIELTTIAARIQTKEINDKTVDEE